MQTKIVPMPVSKDSSHKDNAKGNEKGTMKTPSRTSKRTDENMSPNEDTTPTRKTRRSTRHSSGIQTTLVEMFSKKRPREAESPSPEKKAVKLKIDETESLDKSPDHLEVPTLKTVKIEEESVTLDDLKHSEPISTETNLIIPNTLDDDSTKQKNNTTNGDNVKVENMDVATEEEPEVEICPTCSQIISDPELKFFQGHPQDSVEEYIALTDEKLVLTTSDEGDITERPHVNMTEFSVYDKAGHLCPIDGGLIESDVRLYVSGYLKTICSDSFTLDSECVPVKDVGPIVEWCIHGFDGGKQNCITLSTEYGEYNLLKPSEEYMHLMDNMYERIRISKVTIEYLEEYHYLQPTYEDLLLMIKENSIPELDNKMMTEEMLHKHARFICDQVVSLEVEDDEDPPLITLPCMRELIKLFGIKFGKTKAKSKIQYKKKTTAPSWTKATTTPLVQKTFESFFSNQLDKQAEKDLVLRRKRCGICDQCQLPDCGQCNACRAMAKFGGDGKTKKACIHRTCPNMAVEQAEESEQEDEEEFREMTDKNLTDLEEGVPVKLTGAGVKNITWVGEPIKSEMNKTYYSQVMIDNLQVKIGDFVMVDTLSPTIPHLVTKITYMWKESMTPRAGYFHGQVFVRSSDSVLGEVSDPREVFLADRCCNGAPLSSILRIATVDKKELLSNWFQMGGENTAEEMQEDDGKTYYYRKFYDRVYARFEDLPSDPVCMIESRNHRFCPSCERKSQKYACDIPKVINKLDTNSANVTEANRYEWGSVKWRNHEYKSGDAVFLKSETFKFKNQHSGDRDSTCKIEKVDETIYTEYYRKSDNNLRGSNIDTVEPFCVGYINAVVARSDGPLVIPQDIYLKVNVLYRPENTCKKYADHDDLNLVYWSNNIKEISFSSVMGLCTLTHVDNIPSEMTLTEWSSQDLNRFYFKEAYDKVEDKIIEVPEIAMIIGNAGNKKLKSKGKGKGKGAKTETEPLATSEEIKIRPLRTLDVFAGCGGLSEGLHQSGIAVSKWAIEQMPPAARAYQLNNPNCTVYTEDCNALLKAALDGASHSSGGLPIPGRGEVELLCGGPPCQGFSGMNRFNSREYSNFKNSLVASYLSYCDYYRPKYFILENVRNFVAYKKGMVLKLTLRCLLEIGYQCTFGIVQAGNYGVPQTRRRLIIFAAAPGYKLPLYPEPTHVFSRRACTLSVAIDGKRFSPNIMWYNSAPRRTCTIRDAMSDLPVISNGAMKSEIEYGSLPESHFQRLIRSKDETARLKDHVCKNMAPLIQARICRIPTTPGSDWRDLPNIAVTLSDGTRSKVLQYRHNDTKNGRGAGGCLRGVCGCASRKACTPQDKQDNTLIPWCLPHTGNRHNHWAGLYGRVAWDGYFSTTVTDPEPMGKQGRILHPEQNRVVSVRECARSQGFPDSYIFSGSVQDKHRQIGNAVPPPLGAALGREIKKALAAKS